MAARVGKLWTQEDEETLVTLYASGWKNAEIAERLDRTAGAIGDRLARLRNMGLLSAAKPNPALVRPASLPVEATKYLPENEACAYHAAVVMSQGGFCWLSEKKIGRNSWAVCLPLVWPKKEQAR